MRKNINTADRFIRVIIAAIAAVLLLTNAVTGTAAIVMMAVAGIVLLTGVINFCPIYYVLGISTSGKEEKAV